ncbi:MAG: hypothetical protein ACI3X4_00205, partial [Bacteroidaceae bacterium]
SFFTTCADHEGTHCGSEEITCHRADDLFLIYGIEKTGNKDIKDNIKCCICLFLWERCER